MIRRMFGIRMDVNEGSLEKYIERKKKEEAFYALGTVYSENTIRELIRTAISIRKRTLPIWSLDKYRDLAQDQAINRLCTGVKVKKNDVINILEEILNEIESDPMLVLYWAQDGVDNETT